MQEALRLCMAAAFVLAGLTACGTPTQSLTMSLGAAESLQLRGWVPEALKHNVELDGVKGGEATSRWWGSKVSALTLEQALEDSLRSVGMLPLSPQPGARYQLRVEMVSLVQPLLAADLTVTATVHYSLVDKSNGQLLYQRAVRTAHTTGFSEALLSQPERARLANEAAVRRGIALALRDLMALRVPDSAAAPR